MLGEEKAMRAQPTIEGMGHDGVRSLPLETLSLEPDIVPAPASGTPAPMPALAMLGLLAAALGMPPFFPDALRVGGAPAVTPMGTYVTAGMVAMLAFAFGSVVASGLSVVHTVRTGLLCGALVWGVGVPIVVAGVAAEQRMIAAPQSYVVASAPSGAVVPGATYGASREVPVQARVQQLARGEHIQRTGAVTFIALLLALSASLGGGLLGSLVLFARPPFGGIMPGKKEPRGHVGKTLMMWRTS
jgi:hypothetical protein